MFSLLSQVTSPLDATLAELRLETFVPVDETTRTLLVDLDQMLSDDADVYWLQKKGSLALKETAV